MNPLPQRHLHVDSGPLHLDYQGPADQVLEVAADLAAGGQCTVRVDDELHPGQIPLPCAQLWDPPPQPGNGIPVDRDATRTELENMPDPEGASDNNSEEERMIGTPVGTAAMNIPAADPHECGREQAG
jgi:hypothetical protein